MKITIDRFGAHAEARLWLEDNRIIKLPGFNSNCINKSDGDIIKEAEDYLKIYQSKIDFFKNK